MEPGKIEKRLRVILGEKAALDPASIELHLPLLRDGYELDSLTLASFVAAVQQEFCVDILEEDLSLACLDSLAALARFIEARVENRA